MSLRARQEALLMLAPFFDAVRDVYVKAGYSDLKRTRLEVDEDLHDTPRHFAACRDDGLLIQVAPQMVNLDDATVVAILSHECGHALDFLFPGEFKVVEPGKPARRVTGGKGFERDLKRWRDRSPHEIELAADCIAMLVTGARIRYAGACQTRDHCRLLQTFGSGVERPEWLR